MHNRKLTVFHSIEGTEIENCLTELRLGLLRLETIIVQEFEIDENTSLQSKLFWSVLLINFAFFIIEFAVGFISKTMEWIADSLDMLADVFVLALGLWAVGPTVIRSGN